MLALEGLHFQLQTLAHPRQQTLDGFHAGQNLTALDPADRRLVGARPQGEAALADAVTLPTAPDQLRGIHRAYYV